MKCTCCGKELTRDDRYCTNCGQNNPGYVERVNVESTQTNSYRPNNYNANNYCNYNSNNNTSNGYNNQPIHTQTNYYIKTESKAIGILALIFSILGGWLGLLFSIIGLCTYKEPENKTLCKISLCIFGAWVVLIFILLMAG